MFKINHAVLHVFDFVSCVNVFSEDELELVRHRCPWLRFVAIRYNPR